MRWDELREKRKKGRKKKSTRWAALASTFIHVSCCLQQPASSNEDEDDSTEHCFTLNCQVSLSPLSLSPSIRAESSWVESSLKTPELKLIVNILPFALIIPNYDAAWWLVSIRFDSIKKEYSYMSNEHSFFRSIVRSSSNWKRIGIMRLVAFIWSGWSKKKRWTRVCRSVGRSVCLSVSCSLGALKSDGENIILNSSCFRVHTTSR